MSYRIAHFADIHWHGHHRHDEYKRSFSDAFNQLRVLKPDAIVICGDIFHTKTQGISPEILDCLVWWFNSMADICNVVVTLGNHDGNLANLQRQDTISPIITALNRPEISLYKKSGVFPFSKMGLNWCVFSPFDEEGWENVVPVKGEINVALFHGSVKGAVTDGDFELKDNDVDVGFFESYDFALLGDIHKRQYLARRGTKPWIAYPGSTIQQNFGEQIEKGFLFWDIRSRDDFDVEFKRVKHNMPFVTVKWQGSVKKTLEVSPKSSRIRIKLDQPISQKESEQLKNELLLIGNHDVVWDNNYTIDESSLNFKNVIKKVELRNPKIVKELMRQYFESSELSDDDYVFLDNLIDKFLKECTEEEGVDRGTHWSIKKISFSNTFSYGQNNVVDLTKLNGITGVFGPNKTGKSSIIGTLLYTLFNDTDRGSIKNVHIINSGKDHCRSAVTFDIAGKTYEVERQTIKKESKGVVKGTTHLNFRTLNDKGEFIEDLNGEQRRDTEKPIRKKLGTAEDIMLTSISTQGNADAFIKAGGAARDKAISKFLDLIVFESMAERAKKVSADIKVEVKKAPDREWDTLIQEKNNEAESLKLRLAENEDKIAASQVSLEEILRSLRGTDQNIITQADVDQISELLKKQKNEEQSLHEKVEKLNLVIEKGNSIKRSLISKISEIDIKKFKIKRSKHYELRDALNNITHEYEKAEMTLKEQKRSALKLLEVPCGDDYPTCKYIKDSHEDKKKAEEQKDLVEKILKSVNEAKLAFDKSDISDVESKIEEHSSLNEKLSVIERNLDKAQVQLETLKEKVGEYHSKIIETEKRLEGMIASVVMGDESKRIDSLKRKAKEIKQEIKGYDNDRISIASKIGALEAEIKSLEKEKVRYKKLFNEWRLYQLFISACSKRGIPSIVVRSQLPIINAEINKLLQGIVDFRVSIQKDDNSSETEVYIEGNRPKRILELGSGAEKLISSLALRIALRNASTLPKPDFLIIDEGFGVLDENGIISVGKFLKSLKKWFKHIFIITHVEALKDITDSVLEVHNDNNGSYVNNI